MDVETSEAIDRIGERIDALEASLRAEIRGEASSLRAEIRGESSLLRAESASLRDDFRAESASLRGDLRAESASLRTESASLRDDLRVESASLRGELRNESSSLRTELRAEFREGLAENRRHTEVLFESLRDNIRMLADGFAAMSTKLDSLQR